MDSSNDDQRLFSRMETLSQIAPSKSITADFSSIGKVKRGWDFLSIPSKTFFEKFASMRCKKKGLPSERVFDTTAKELEPKKIGSKHIGIDSLQIYVTTSITQPRYLLFTGGRRSRAHSSQWYTSRKSTIESKYFFDATTSSWRKHRGEVHYSVQRPRHGEHQSDALRLLQQRSCRRNEITIDVFVIYHSYLGPLDK